MTAVYIKRIYETPDADDGFRVLVDRLWPRGVSKDAAQLDEWNKDIAPSTDLRKWFDHDPDRWDEFRDRYRSELEDLSEQIGELLKRVGEDTLTLLYAAKNPELNHALVLAEFIEQL